MSLTEKLAEKKALSASKVPAEKWAIMQKSTQDLQKQSLSTQALREGEMFPTHDLLDVNSRAVNIQDFLGKGHLVVSFYRGGWCPYCNLELRALQAILPQLKQLGTSLIAISPEMPDHSLSTSEKNSLAFAVLSDLDNAFAKKLGLVFQMPEDLRAVYHSFNLDVPKHNGNQDYELPMPATYIVAPTGKIVYAFVPEDYTERLAPETILEVLNKAISVHS